MVDCSRAAWRCGVRVGMPLPEALALVRRATRKTNSATTLETVVERHEPGVDLAALAELAQRCEQFSPLVGWETVGGVPRWIGRSLPGGSAPNVPAASSTAAGSAATSSVSGHTVSGHTAAYSDPPYPSHLWLDITGIGPLFGGELQLVSELKGALSAWGYVAWGAVADSVGAAWACADADWPIVPLGQSAAVVRSRSIETLRLPPAVLGTLRELGIEQIEQLERLPRAGLAARFGPGLGLRLDQALGVIPQPTTAPGWQVWTVSGAGDERGGGIADVDEWIWPYREPPRFSVERILDEPVGRREWIERLVEEGLRELGTRLQQAGMGALELRGRVDCGGGRPVELRIGLFRPSACERHWVELARLQMERVKWPGPVGRLSWQASAVAPLSERQRELFQRSDGSMGDERVVGELLERLGGRLGPAAVLRPRLAAAALPEQAVTYESALGESRVDNSRPGARSTPSRQRPASRRRSARRPRVDTTNQRPNADSQPTAGHPLSSAESASEVGGERDWRRGLRSGVVEEGEWLRATGYRPVELLRPPVAIEVVAVAPEGPPQALRWRREWLRIVANWGPERIETGWWRADAARRDYYRVATERGCRYWIYRDRATQRWHLHGLFS
ncbi:MAG: DNA polymerase Y family protein [Pirellulales bacterium]